MTFIANARMYSVTPGAAAAWKRLFAWLAQHSGVPLVAIDHAAPAPLEALWARDDLACAFMCGFPFARSAVKPTIVAAPVPSGSRYAGKPVYMTDLVVRADAPFQTLHDTFGTRMGYTVESSQSGCNAPRHHLLGLRSKKDTRFYAASVGPLITPRRVIEALIAGEIDVGPLDSFAHDLFRRHDPALAGRLRTVVTTAPVPIPSLIANSACPDHVIEQLRASLLAFSTDADCADLRDELCIAGFVPMQPEGYDITLAWERAAIEAGYPMPA